MKKIIVLLTVFYLGITAFGTHAQTPDSPFVLVFIDDATEKKLGAFPIDRAYIAQAVTLINAAKPKGIVLKFFYDQAKDSLSDNKLASAIGKANVLLQASINDNERTPNPFAQKFYLSSLRGTIKTPLQGNSGLIPHKIFSAQASDIGFIDSQSLDRVPIIERFKGAPVKSMYLATIEMATGQTADIELGKAVKFGKQTLLMTDDNQVVIDFPKPTKLDYIALHDLLDGKVDAALFKNKVVIVGYDGSKSPTVKSKYGALKLHRAFIAGLDSAYAQLK